MVFWRQRKDALLFIGNPAAPMGWGHGQMGTAISVHEKS
jgi:hypothetical protein